jgi:hypothetical protein
MAQSAASSRSPVASPTSESNSCVDPVSANPNGLSRLASDATMRLRACRRAGVCLAAASFLYEPVTS